MIGGRPAPGPRAVAPLGDPILVDLANDLAIAPASSDLVEHISAHNGNLPCVSRSAPYLRYSSMLPLGSGPPPPAQKVHLSILPRVPKLPIFGYCGAPNGQA